MVVLLLLLLQIHTAEEETLVVFLSEPVSKQGRISLMATHTHIHEFTPHQPANPPPEDDYYMMFG